MNHVRLFSGSEITTLAVKDILEENNIEFILRDDIQSAISAGFGSADKAVHVFVYTSDLPKAQQLLLDNNITE
ncbi:DUF2007 domain-containing protein [Flavobacterium sp. JP2137]|uniref:DUF2007 domain-containing protein n=1 Tax=Flavobacterium sp. JP2137 TaxID=3414510 RepID=UPI003D3013F8